ncbi:MAG: hypothetical protein ACP5IL_13470 [Syntrophobacteraceae bacterium]
MSCFLRHGSTVSSACFLFMRDAPPVLPGAVWGSSFLLFVPACNRFHKGIDLNAYVRLMGNYEHQDTLKDQNGGEVMGRNMDTKKDAKKKPAKSMKEKKAEKKSKKQLKEV